MKTFSSLAAVMALWLAVSFLLWLFYRLFRRRDGFKQKRILSSALGLIEEASAIFAGLRTRASAKVRAQGDYASNPVLPEETSREDVRSLLNGIEAQSGYFDRVNAAKKKIEQTFGVEDFAALSEILQIRRDFWAASEIFLMEGIQELGPELSDARSFETFQAEARSLLFKESAAPAPLPGQDPVELRLAIAREEAMAFQAEAERAIAASLERSRFPTAAELIAVPHSLVKAVAAGLRGTRDLFGDATATARSLARAMTPKGLKGAAEELRGARAAMPGQFAAAFERAGGLARQGGQSLKRHYEFVLEAQELRARYAELLARAPDLSEKGKQFLARLELERRAEQFRETSGDILDWARQSVVVGIAYLIAGLQYVQAKVTPAEHKQLAPLAAGHAAASSPAPDPGGKPLRALLLSASAYSGGNYGQAESRMEPRPKRQAGRRAATAGEAFEARDRKEHGAGLRDLLAGGSTASGNHGSGKPPQRKPRAQSKPHISYSDGLKKTSFKDLLAETAMEMEEDLADTGEPSQAPNGRRGGKPRPGGGSLLERLSSMDPATPAEPGDTGSSPAKEETKGRWFDLFKPKDKI